MPARLLALVVVCLFALAACETPPLNLQAKALESVPDDCKRALQSRPPTPTKLLNSSPLDCERAQASAGRPPKIALALSGGGTKAAVFSHGVLHGLNEAGLLDSVDVISSTSGGGYAAYWLMSKRMDALDQPELFGPKGYRAIFDDCFPAWFGHPTLPSQKKMRDEAVRRAWTSGMEVCERDVHYSMRDGSDPYRWQAHLLRWPDVFKPGYTPVLAWLPDNVPYYTDANGMLATIFEGLFSPLQRRESYVAWTYQAGIERAWGLDPKPRVPPVHDRLSAWKYTNSATSDDSERWTRPILHVNAATMSWDRLRTAYAKAPAASQKLPLWVLNTTEGQKGPQGNKQLPQPNAGNLFEITPFSYGSPRWGYVLDEGPDQLATIARAVRASAAFADSQGVGNPDLAKRLEMAGNVVTAAKWGVSFAHKEAPGTTLHLSDGGGADNLALVSAVRRGVTDVIVADTAHDPRGTMEDLCWSIALLKQADEKAEITADFPALENFSQVCSDVLDGSLPKHIKIYDVDAWVNPVIHGALKWPDGRQVQVWLIKAAWNEQAARAAFNAARCGFKSGEYNCLLAMFWGTSLNPSASGRKAVEVFPQNGTAAQTLNGSPLLVLAYRELGRMAASQLKIGEGGRIELREPVQCYQRVMSREHQPLACFSD